LAITNPPRSAIFLR